MTGLIQAQPVERAAPLVRAGLVQAASRLEGLGLPIPDFKGRLHRPLVAYSAAPGVADDPKTGDPFWLAVLAVQLAHEASLLHDDVIDGAKTRRGAPSVVTRSGTAAAIVQGDHLLTGAYRVAALSGSMPFVSLFARAVERTVAGERRQAEMAPELPNAGAWRDVLLGKSGELFGCALAIGSVLGGSGPVEPVFELGRRIGLAYQMVDDLMDYCPSAATGKSPLADYQAGRWTWVLADAPTLAFGCQEHEVLGALFDGANAPARQALGRLESEIDVLTRDLARVLGPSATLQSLLEEWRMRARDSVRREAMRVARGWGANGSAVTGFTAAGFAANASTTADPSAGDSRAADPSSGDPAAADPSVAYGAPAPPPRPGEWIHYLGHHGRSFRFATSFMPAAERERVAAVYAWCRYTDDVVDRACTTDVDARLDEWLGTSRAAYEGEKTGIDLADQVMAYTREAGVPFTYPAELIAGMRMDLRHRPYNDLRELQLYTWRAAGTVGLWLAELYGVREAWAIDRAAGLGQAMQLTNIIRDVGEDLGRGRLYLPLDRLHAHGLSRVQLEHARETGEPLGDGWLSLLEELMGIAERDYDLATEALPELPVAFRRAVTVAGAVYGGIHDAVRRIDYDTLRRRAVTTKRDKVALGARALMRLGSASPVSRRSVAAAPLLEAVSG